MMNKTNNTNKSNNTKSLKHYISNINIAHLMAAVGAVVIFTTTSFYFTNGYIDIGNDKYIAFMHTAPIFVILWLLVRIGQYVTSKEPKKIPEMILEFGAADWFTVMLVTVGVISVLTSDHKRIAVWGQDGWNMGLIVWLLMIGMYLFTRDMAKDASEKFLKGLFNTLIGISVPVFILGTINRYSIYPIHMMGEAEDFISTIGNINWFNGYWCVWFGLGTGAFLVTKSKKARILYGVYLWICAMAGVSCGSSSSYLAYLAIGFAALLWALEDTGRIADLCIVQIILFAALPSIRIIGWLRPNRMWYDSKLLYGITYGDTWLKPWVAGTVFFAVLYEICVYFKAHPKARKTKAAETADSSKKADAPETDGGFKIRDLRSILIGVSVGGVAAVILIIAINTVIPGGIWPVRGMGIFTWSISWGNGRGGIWIATLKIIQTLLPLRIFFGAGPDCFCIYAYSMQDMALLLNRYIGNQYLTCAHNEILTMIVNEGIFGAVAYVGFMITHLRDAIKGKVFLGLMLSAAAYITVGVVGFMQILSTPWFFVVLGAMAGLNKRKH